MAVMFVLNSKISNAAGKIVQLGRTEVHIDPEEEGSKIVENVVLLPFFRSMTEECTVDVACHEGLTFLC